MGIRNRGITCGQTKPKVQASRATSGRQNSNSWNTADLLHATNLLEQAYKFERKERDALDVYLVRLLDRGDLSEYDFNEITNSYYSSLEATEYYSQMGNYFKQYILFQQGERKIPPRNLRVSSLKQVSESVQKAVNKAIFKTSEKEICSALQSMDMPKAKKLLRDWLSHMVDIDKQRKLAAYHSSGTLERKIQFHRTNVRTHQRNFQITARILKEYYTGLREIDEANKFVDKLKEIKDLNDDLHFVVNALKNPVKEMGDKVLGDLNGIIMEGTTKWDVIKAGIRRLGEYLVTTELVAKYEITLNQLFSDYSLAIEGILENSNAVILLEQWEHKINLKEESNPFLIVISNWGKI